MTLPQKKKKRGAHVSNKCNFQKVELGIIRVTSAESHSKVERSPSSRFPPTTLPFPTRESGMSVHQPYTRLPLGWVPMGSTSNSGWCKEAAETSSVFYFSYIVWVKVKVANSQLPRHHPWCHQSGFNFQLSLSQFPTLKTQFLGYLFLFLPTFVIFSSSLLDFRVCNF